MCDLDVKEVKPKFSLNGPQLWGQTVGGVLDDVQLQECGEQFNVIWMVPLCFLWINKAVLMLWNYGRREKWRYRNKERDKSGREPWSSGYVRWLIFKRSWVQIPVPYTGWTWHFFTLICCKNCIVCWKDKKYMKKRPGRAQFLKMCKGEREKVGWGKSL